MIWLLTCFVEIVRADRAAVVKERKIKTKHKGELEWIVRIWDIFTTSSRNIDAYYLSIALTTLVPTIHNTLLDYNRTIHLDIYFIVSPKCPPPHRPLEYVVFFFLPTLFPTYNMYRRTLDYSINGIRDKDSYLYSCFIYIYSYAVEKNQGKLNLFIVECQ